MECRNSQQPQEAPQRKKPSRSRHLRRPDQTHLQGQISIASATKSGTDLAAEFNILKDLIVHMHLDDGRSFGVSEHLPLGEGSADFSPLAPFISKMEGAVVLEIYAPERPVEAILESRNFLMKILEVAADV